MYYYYIFGLFEMCDYRVPPHRYRHFLAALVVYNGVLLAQHHWTFGAASDANVRWGRRASRS